MRKLLLDMKKDFLIMSNIYLVEILGVPNSLTIVTSKTYSKFALWFVKNQIFLPNLENI